MNEIFENFDWKNGKFDSIQEAYLKQFAEDQIKTYLSGKTNEELAVKHLNNVYAQLGKNKPNIIWFDSPKAMIDSVRDSVGASVGASVGDSVGDSVWASVRASVGASVEASVWASVRASVWASVEASVEASVWASVGASVEASVRASVGASVWASVRASVEASVGASVRSYDVANWSSFYKFFSENFEKNALEDWCLYSEQVTGGILSDDTAYLVRKLKRLVRGNNGRLDYDHDKAIEWNDGYGFYYLRGVEFDYKTWKDIVDQKITLKNLSKITNADQRAVAVQMLRADRLLKQVNAKKIDTGSKGVELYKVPNFMDTGETEYCMKLEHPSIKGKEYIEWVEPKIGKEGSADYCMAVSRGITVEDYLNAEVA